VALICLLAFTYYYFIFFTLAESRKKGKGGKCRRLGRICQEKKKRRGEENIYIARGRPGREREEGAPASRRKSSVKKKKRRGTSHPALSLISNYLLFRRKGEKEEKKPSVKKKKGRVMACHYFQPSISSLPGTPGGERKGGGKGSAPPALDKKGRGEKEKPYLSPLLCLSMDRREGGKGKKQF